MPQSVYLPSTQAPNHIKHITTLPLLGTAPHSQTSTAHTIIPQYFDPSSVNDHWAPTGAHCLWVYSTLFPSASPTLARGSTSYCGRLKPTLTRPMRETLSSNLVSMRKTVSRYIVEVVQSYEQPTMRFIPPSEPAMRKHVGGRAARNRVTVMLPS